MERSDYCSKCAGDGALCAPWPNGEDPYREHERQCPACGGTGRTEESIAAEVDRAVRFD